uniref:Uncharacterized protein n=1 Tax=viral metagenome TaxID=1070528 RepID=A0A6C0DUT8_9ZZZZ
MKFYESHYEEYNQAIEKYNIHPELLEIYNKMPSQSKKMENLIFYGPSGIGKYSQVLHFIKKYSPSELKYDKKMIINTDKQQYVYRISDIHYEVDMSLLGCNSKLVWHDLFFQIIDIISVKPDKFGIILCKNFHQIHSELLEIFYSYMQQYNHSQTNLKVVFIIMTEHLSFLPTPIIHSCKTINIRRPNKSDYINILPKNNMNIIMDASSTACESGALANGNHIVSDKNNAIAIMDIIDAECIMNAKEIKSFSIINNIETIPNDIFNIICDNIISEILKTVPLSFTGFRDVLYDILTYNLDVSECLWYIINSLIQNGHLQNDDITDVMNKTYLFLKYYNNNYRPIYHLESIMFYIITKIRGYSTIQK